MKKTAISLTVALAGFTTVAQSALKDEIWYTGGKLGWSQYHNTGFENRTNNSTYMDKLSAGAFVGYQAHQYLNFELEYDWLGRMPYKDGVNSGVFKAQGASLAAKLSYPLMDSLNVYARLGSMMWRIDSKSANNDNTSRTSSHDTGVSPLATVGFEYVWTKNWATHLDYQWTKDIGNAAVGAQPDNSMLNMGISYRFGQNKNEVTTTMLDPVSIAPQEKSFTLKSDVLFNFDESILKPEAQQELDQLYSQLTTMDPKDSSVIVLGYTDRIGSDIYNQKLSQDRAQSVMNYLTSKGILSNKITAHGMGKSNSVTGNTCDNMKSRSLTINCLAPDRRVEVEVQGIKDVLTQPEEEY